MYELMLTDTATGNTMSWKARNEDEELIMASLLIELGSRVPEATSFADALANGATATRNNHPRVA